MLKREAIDDDLSSQIFKQAHVLFKAIAHWSHRLYEVVFTFINIVLQKSKYSQVVTGPKLFIGFIKFIYPEKAKKFCEISTVDLTVTKCLLNSEWIYEVIVSPKLPNKIFKDVFGDDIINPFWI